ncbi:MAG: glycosyltransferase family 4 protein [bacterium]
MRIGVDGFPYYFKAAGIARYLTAMLTEMFGLAPEVEFLIYVPAPVEVPLPANNNWHLRVVKSLLSARPALWTQLALPGALAVDGTDVFWGQPLILPLRLKKRCLRILTIHDLVPYVDPGSMKFQSWLQMRLRLRPIAHAADLVICVSETTARLAQTFLRLPQEKIRVIKEAAAPFFKPVELFEAKRTVVERFGISDDYMIFVSTVEPRKEHLLLLKALEMVGDAPLLVLVGGIGWRCGKILREIRRFEDRGRVRYLGRVDDEMLPALYSAARLSVYPSRYEGFGLPVLEAMACGCPVLASDSSSLPEIGGEAAEYFRTGDVEDLARKLRLLIGDKNRLQAMTVRGFQQVERFSFRIAAREFLTLIKS